MTTSQPTGIKIVISSLGWCGQPGTVRFETSDPFVAAAWIAQHVSFPFAPLTYGRDDVFTYATVNGIYDGDLSDAIDLNRVEGPSQFHGDDEIRENDDFELCDGVTCDHAECAEFMDMMANIAASVPAPLHHITGTKSYQGRTWFTCSCGEMIDGEITTDAFDYADDFDF